MIEWFCGCVLCCDVAVGGAKHNTTTQHTHRYRQCVMHAVVTGWWCAGGRLECAWIGGVECRRLQTVLHSATAWHCKVPSLSLSFSVFLFLSFFLSFLLSFGSDHNSVVCLHIYVLVCTFFVLCVKRFTTHSLSSHFHLILHHNHCSSRPQH